jgi:hypothetical protein
MITTKRQAARLVGKTIREVELRRLKDKNGRTAVEPVITLDDGTRLYFGVAELEDDYAVTMGEIRVGRKE